jgi:hypothetical protein
MPGATTTRTTVHPRPAVTHHALTPSWESR